MTTRRAYGSGSIEEHGAGWRWVARINGKRVKSPPYATREEAAAVLGEALRLSSSGDVAPVAGLTLRQWGNIWLRRREDSGVRSLKADRSRWQRHVLAAPFIDLALREIRKRDLKAWVAKLQRTAGAEQQLGGAFAAGGERLSPQTIRHCVNLVRGALAAAVDDELLDVNPADKIRIDAPPQTDEPWTYLTEFEIAQLFEFLGRETARARPRERVAELVAVYAVAIYAGLRKGEIIPLRWVDVDLGERPQITVRYSRQGGTKSGKIRRVPLLAPAAEALRAWRAESFEAEKQKTDRAAALVFPSPRGGAWHEDHEFGWPDTRRGAQGMSPGVKTRCGIAREVRFHDLRHSCASHLVMGTWGRTWRLDEVRDLLGHSDVETTQRYAHLSPEHLHAAAAATAPAASAAPGTSQCPQNVPSDSSNSADSRQWALQDSNLRPLASEANGKAHEIKGFAPFWGHLGDIHRKAAARLLSLVADGAPVPIELLDVLGIPEGEHALRQAVKEARALLMQPPTSEQRSVP